MFDTSMAAQRAFRVLKTMIISLWPNIIIITTHPYNVIITTHPYNVTKLGDLSEYPNTDAATLYRWMRPRNRHGPLTRVRVAKIYTLFTSNRRMMTWLVTNRSYIWVSSAEAINNNANGQMISRCVGSNDQHKILLFDGPEESKLFRSCIKTCEELLKGTRFTEGFSGLYPSEHESVWNRSLEQQNLFDAISHK